MIEGSLKFSHLCSVSQLDAVLRHTQDIRYRNRLKTEEISKQRSLLRVRGLHIFIDYSVAYEGTQSNRVSDFRDFVCSLFPKAILFDFYLTCRISFSTLKIVSDE